MTFACSPNGRTSAGIDWPLLSPDKSGEAEVILRLDSDKPTTAKWSRRDNSTVLEDAAGFAQEVARHKTLAARATLGERTYTAVFDVSQIREKAAQVAAECRWQF